MIKSYLKLADMLDETQAVIKKDKTEEAKKSEQSGSLYNLLHLYT